METLPDILRHRSDAAVASGLGSHSEGGVFGHTRSYCARALLPNSLQGSRGYALSKGLAYRYTELKYGLEPILGFLVPGDFVEFDAARAFRVRALISSDVSFIQSDLNTRSDVSAIDHAFGGARRLELQIVRQWLINVGTRSAIERTAHLLCELYVRLGNGGLAEAQSCQIPLTQTDLARALAMTPVHLNRTLKILRSEGLVQIRQRMLKIDDFQRLAQRAGFDDRYLRLEPV